MTTLTPVYDPGCTCTHCRRRQRQGSPSPIPPPGVLRAAEVLAPFVPAGRAVELAARMLHAAGDQ